MLVYQSVTKWRCDWDNPLEMEDCPVVFDDTGAYHITTDGQITTYAAKLCLNHLVVDGY